MDNSDEINSIFDEMLKDAKATKVISNFIMVAEVIGDETELIISVSSSMTPWMANGMLNSAIDIVASGEHETYNNNRNSEEE